MTLALRIAAIIIGVFLILPGLAGVFRTERMAEALAIAPQSASGTVAISVLIGAPYLAMGLVTLYGAIRKQWALLLPIAAIEGAMAVVRIASGFNYGFEVAGLVEIVLEITICVVLTLGGFLPARSAK